MSERRVNAFFYGLFMDMDLLRASGVAPAHPRRAAVDGFALRIGQRATLWPAAGRRVYGVLASLTHAELDRLYSAPGLERYRAEAVLAHPFEGAPTAALCYNLVEPPAPGERNPEYARRLRQALETLGFPPDYIASVA